MTIVTRFAPSPTGELHLGSAYAAWVAWHRAREADGRFLVRIEDIDRRRCHPEYETAILEDLRWLGFGWDGEVRRQSEHFADYGRALDLLKARDLIYPCFCSRSDIAAATNAPQGPHGPIYLGTCRYILLPERRARIAAGHEFCLRLDTQFAERQVGPCHFFDEAHGRIEGRPRLMGDVVLARKDTPTSYHLSVTVDDHLQGVTLVTRGEDLLPSTHIHVLLQKLLGYETPQYAHHKLLGNEHRRRFAKRDRSLTIVALRESGMAAEEVVKLAVGWEHAAIQ